MTMPKNEKILYYLSSGHSLTPLEALKMFNCFRLASVVCKLKKEGVDIVSNIVYNEETGSHFAEYHLRTERG